MVAAVIRRTDLADLTSKNIISLKFRSQWMYDWNPILLMVALYVTALALPGSKLYKLIFVPFFLHQGGTDNSIFYFGIQNRTTLCSTGSQILVLFCELLKNWKRKASQLDHGLVTQHFSLLDETYIIIMFADPTDRILVVEPFSAKNNLCSKQPFFIFYLWVRQPHSCHDMTSGLPWVSHLLA